MRYSILFLFRIYQYIVGYRDAHNRHWNRPISSVLDLQYHPLWVTLYFKYLQFETFIAQDPVKS